MATDKAAETTAITAEEVERELLAFLARRLKNEFAPDLDLFKTGLVSSLFAMELVVHVESTYEIAVIGPDLKLDNFRTVQRMTALRVKETSILGIGTPHDWATSRRGRSSWFRPQTQEPAVVFVAKVTVFHAFELPCPRRLKASDSRRGERDPGNRQCRMRLGIAALITQCCISASIGSFL
jgi:methoxymalonate biosynthesis acyl carrier protein